MHKIDGRALFGALDFLANMDGIASQDPEWVYKSQRVGFMVDTLNQLTQQLEILDTRLAINKARVMSLCLMSVSKNYGAAAVAQSFSGDLKELRARLAEELEDRALYHVRPPQARSIDEGELTFGQVVIDCFPNMTTDLGEAAVCLGLSRNTACVFHLMRAVESAVAEIGRRLGATIVDKNNVELNWGVIIANMNATIEKMPKGKDRDEWSEVASHLFHVKNSWRNRTMHPKHTYTDDEADEIFSAVKSFLRCLAEAWST